MNTTTHAMNEILQHDSYIGAVLDCAEDMKNIKNSSIQSTQNRVMKGIESKHDYRMMYSAQHSEEDWEALAQRYGLGSIPTYHPQTKDVPTSKAKVKRMPRHGSYVQSKASNAELVDSWVRYLNNEVAYGMYSTSEMSFFSDKVQLIKITGFEFRKPYLIISAISAVDEHERLTQTRSMDEVSEFYFTFTIATDEEGKLHPEFERLRRFIWNKVSHDGKQTLASMLRQLIDRVVTINLQQWIQLKGKDGKPQFKKNGKPLMVEHPDFLGYPSYSYEDKIDEDFTHTCDHKGSYENLPLKSFKSATNCRLVANA